MSGPWKPTIVHRHFAVLHSFGTVVVVIVERKGELRILLRIDLIDWLLPLAKTAWQNAFWHGCKYFCRFFERHWGHCLVLANRRQRFILDGPPEWRPCFLRDLRLRSLLLISSFSTMKHACVDELNCMYVRFIKSKLVFLVDMKIRDVQQKLPSDPVVVKSACTKVLPRSNSQVRTFGLCVSSLSRTIFLLASPCLCLFDDRRTKRQCCKWPNKFTVRLRLTVTRPASCWFEITDKV